MCTFVFFFFFFQAEDGIRDWSVTGVQTCALPILHGYWEVSLANKASAAPPPKNAGRAGTRHAAGGVRRPVTSNAERSEERRVGKECRCRRSTNEYKKDTERV